MMQLAKYVDYKQCLSMEIPPIGSGRRGAYLIADSKGKDIYIDGDLVRWGQRGSGHWVFHPTHTTDGCIIEQIQLDSFERTKKEVDVVIDNLQKAISFLVKKYGDK